MFRSVGPEYLSPLSFLVSSSKTHEIRRDRTAARETLTQRYFALCPLPLDFYSGERGKKDSVLGIRIMFIRGTGKGGLRVPGASYV